jgi:iron complex transport system substrate-binding protein
MWSTIADQVKSLPRNHGLAEEIIPLQPDIVLAGEFDNPEAVSLLQRLGVSVQRLPLPRVLDDLSRQVIQVGELVGVQPQAEIMAARITQQLQNLAAVKQQSVIKQQAQQLTAFWYSSNGVVIGNGTLEHELMQLAGLRNLAAEQGIYGFSPLDLELLLVSKPQILIIEESNADAFSLAKEYVSHPALGNASFTIIRLPAGLSGCAASVVGDVTDALKKALADQTPH